MRLELNDSSLTACLPPRSGNGASAYRNDMNRRQWTTETTVACLDTIAGNADRLSHLQVLETVDGLMQSLSRDRANMGAQRWQEHCDAVRQHPAMQRLLEDPFTARCFVKPRGYAGDAATLDLIYRHESVRTLVSETTDFGRRVYACTSTTRASRAVVHRRDLLAAQIDRICETRAAARILSVGCGHMREASVSRAVGHGLFKEFVALDQDEHSIAVVHSQLRAYGVRAIATPLQTLVSDASSRLGAFDFIYAAGLYENLSQPFAERLTASLTSLLKSGGVLWVASLAPEVTFSGYMEACMDWWLNYRDEDQMRSLASEFQKDAPLACRTFRECNGDMVVLEAKRI